MSVYVASIKGRRDKNEDKHDIIINSNGRNKQLNNIDFYAVYDGHGGNEVSTYLKDRLSPHFTKKNLIYPLPQKYVIKVYDYLQNSLRNHKFAYRAGSTGLVVIVFLLNGKKSLSIFNNGDCRCIICRRNIAIPLTKDHKPHWPEELYRIDKIGGEKIDWSGHDPRINGLSVSRSFGDLDSVPEVTHRPQLFGYTLGKDDKFIIMACDGLWDVLDNSEACNFVLMNCYDRTLKIRINKKNDIAQKLAEYALKKGSGDNVTVIVVFFD
uniref:Protein phosphatase 2C n=1 Tax=Mimivirus LCMiAC02 TaxID=2506609 RepID=A0A481Z2B4_9VIRU|nr:MAG: protein phosphatase 2C [Mimivirus LCMiAC02]